MFNEDESRFEEVQSKKIKMNGYWKTLPGGRMLEKHSLFNLVKIEKRVHACCL